jgi:hypothetical protein
MPLILSTLPKHHTMPLNTITCRIHIPFGVPSRRIAKKKLQKGNGTAGLHSPLEQITETHDRCLIGFLRQSIFCSWDYLYLASCYKHFPWRQTARYWAEERKLAARVNKNQLDSCWLFEEKAPDCKSSDGLSGRNCSFLNRKRMWSHFVTLVESCILPAWNSSGSLLSVLLIFSFRLIITI